MIRPQSWHYYNCSAFIQRNTNNSTMKDFVLSLLSRGYGRIVANEDGHDGRLEVCFEPEVNVFICRYKTCLISLNAHSQWKHDLLLTRTTSTGNPSLHCCVWPAADAFLKAWSQFLPRPSVRGEDLLFCTPRIWPWRTGLARVTGRERLRAAPNRKWSSSCTLYKTWLELFWLSEKRR